MSPTRNDKIYILNGKEYRHSQYYALKKRERLKKAEEYETSLNTAAAAQSTLTDEWKRVVAQWGRVESTVMRTFEAKTCEPNDVVVMDETVDRPFHHTNCDVENMDPPLNHPNVDDNIDHPLHTTLEVVDEDAPDVENDIFSGEDDLPCTVVSSSEMDISEQYLPPAVFPIINRGPCERQSAREEAIVKLHTIFTVHKATARLQNAILQFLNEVPQDVVNELPRYHTTLRPAKIPYERYPLYPGEMIYFGIASVLTLPGLDLFDHTKNKILLSISIDGLPLCRDGNGVGFWPITAAVDQYPVFLVGLYCGKSKPECPNAFMRPLVKELLRLENEGLHVPVVNAPCISSTAITDNCGVKVYSVRIFNLIMDLPALSYITCIIGHAGANACPRCTNPGKQVTLSGLGLNKKGVMKKGIRYIDVYDAAPRMHEDFRVYFKHCLHKKLNTGRLVTDCCMHYSDVREHCESNDDETDTLFKDVFQEYDKDDFLDPDNQLATNKHHIDFLLRHHHQEHRTKKNMENADHVTILFLLKHFNIINDVPVEYMHAVCLGVMQSLLFKWTRAVGFKLTHEKESQVSARLVMMRQYFPVEFQRKPEALNCLRNWKATQYRSFLLYLGVVALHDILDVKKLHHFQVLVTAMRMLSCRVDSVGDRERIMKGRAKKADALLRYFVEDAIHIYSAQFASLKLHLLLHIVEDYLRFGPLDLWSAFRFESILGKLKTLVYAHRYPASQLINAYSSLLQTGQFGKVGNRSIDSLEEYFEEPVLKYPYNDILDEWTGGQLCKETLTQCYKRLYVKAFVIRTDNEADSCCVVKGNIFLKVRKIVHNSSSNCIYLCGNTFDHIESFYSVNIPHDDSGVNAV